MTTVPLEKAQAELPELVKRVLAGEEIVISADGTQLRLEVVKAATPRRGRGLFKGQFVVGPEFFEPLPEDELKYWEGRNDE